MAGEAVFEIEGGDYDLRVNFQIEIPSTEYGKRQYG